MVFEGKEIQNHQPRQIVQVGIARTFQNIRLFPNMRVIEHDMNVVMNISRPDLCDRSRTEDCRRTSR